MTDAVVLVGLFSSASPGPPGVPSLITSSAGICSWNVSLEFSPLMLKRTHFFAPFPPKHYPLFAHHLPPASFLAALPRAARKGARPAFLPAFIPTVRPSLIRRLQSLTLPIIIPA